jgi:hypothetical protein
MIVAFIRLNGRNSLQMCGEIYPTKNITSIIMKELCAEIKKHFKSLVILKFIRNEIK